MSDVPETFEGSYYNRDYFVTPKGKKFRTADGSLQGWSYDNPTGEFLGAGPIAEAWKEIFDPKELLDVGCGRGTFVAYARDAGIEAFGFDYSPWAVGEGRYPRCDESWLRVHDATKRWPYETEEYELVAALDFFEHIYETDLDRVIGEMRRVAERYLFLQIATVKEGGYILKKGEPVPLGLEGNAVAGHVTLRTEGWWLDRLLNDDWWQRRDMFEHFCGLVDPNIISNWLLNSIIILERI